MNKEYNIEEMYIGEVCDEGPWRGLHLTASGNTREELIEDAYIWKIDQDGGECGGYPLGEACKETYDAAMKVIEAQNKPGDDRHVDSQNSKSGI